MTTELDLDFCLRQLCSLANQNSRTWKDVRDRALLAKIAIDKALGVGNVYSSWVNRIISDVCLEDQEVIDATITLRFANLVDAAIRTHDNFAVSPRN